MTSPARARHPPGPDHDHRPGPAGQAGRAHGEPHPHAGRGGRTTHIRSHQETHPRRATGPQICGRLSDAPVSSAVQQHKARPAGQAAYLCNAATCEECPLLPPGERAELWPGAVLLRELPFERSSVRAFAGWRPARRVSSPASGSCHQHDRARADSERRSHRGAERGFATAKDPATNDISRGWCPLMGWTPTGFVDTIRSGTMVYEERTGSGTGSQEVHPGI